MRGIRLGAGVQDFVARVAPLLGDPCTEDALRILRRDFLDPDAVGPRRVAEFLFDAAAVDLQADVVGFLSRFQDACDRNLRG